MYRVYKLIHKLRRSRSSKTDSKQSWDISTCSYFSSHSFTPFWKQAPHSKIFLECKDLMIARIYAANHHQTILYWHTTLVTVLDLAQAPKLEVLKQKQKPRHPETLKTGGGQSSIDSILLSSLRPNRHEHQQAELLANNFIILKIL
ncbi:predicted protein [Botrytis cinerea T4]|uniref:Uncharacterized protein n=1 Tax=Botryotinia fuckeliana (strain T4) TaxID=999810 RepID=G2YYM8_BOTF4|nr:predicted protein [Botrytis cinerea T4]